jgi:O-antigen biosynthesis protein
MDFVYDLTVDPEAENNTHAFALGMIGHNKSVLEVGCATGYFTKALAQRGCKVVGIELDPEAAKVAEDWAERVVVGDVDDLNLWNLVDDESFDVITMGDVLEHLRDPLAVLRMAVRKLKTTGFIVTSLPNVAHGDVRLSLLHGSFPYRDTGLLDRTHIRFFTLQTIRDLLYEAGLVVVETERVVMPLFCSEIGVRREDYAVEVLDEIRSDSEVETYQFVMKSVVDNGSQAVADMANRLDEVSDARHEAEVQRKLLEEQLVGYADMQLQVSDMQLQFSEISAERDRLIEQAGTLSGRIGDLTGQIQRLEEELAATAARAGEYGRTAHALNLALQERQRKLDSLKNSRSFRVTAPLRRLGAAIRRPAQP